MLDVLNDHFAHIFEPELLEEISKTGKYVKVEAGGTLMEMVVL